jgi:hypothetical protein
MVSMMKTTVELPDALVEEARKVAAQRGITLHELLEEGLRSVVAAGSGARGRFVLRDARASKGRLRPEYEGNWPAIRDEIYKGRGT